MALPEIPKMDFQQQHVNQLPVAVTFDTKRGTTSATYQNDGKSIFSAMGETFDALGDALGEVSPFTEKGKAGILGALNTANEQIEEYGKDTYEINPDDGFWANFGKRLGSSFLEVGKIIPSIGIGLMQLSTSAAPTVEKGLQPTKEVGKAVGKGILKGIDDTLQHPYDTHIKPVVDSFTDAVDNPFENKSGNFAKELVKAELKVYGAAKSVEAVSSVAQGASSAVENVGAIAAKTAKEATATIQPQLCAALTPQGTTVPLAIPGALSATTASLTEAAGQVAGASVQAATGLATLGVTEAVLNPEQITPPVPQPNQNSAPNSPSKSSTPSTSGSTSGTSTSGSTSGTSASSPSTPGSTPGKSGSVSSTTTSSSSSVPITGRTTLSADIRRTYSSERITLPKTLPTNTKPISATKYIIGKGKKAREVKIPNSVLRDASDALERGYVQHANGDFGIKFIQKADPKLSRTIAGGCDVELKMPGAARFLGKINGSGEIEWQFYAPQGCHADKVMSAGNCYEVYRLAN